MLLTTKATVAQEITPAILNSTGGSASNGISLEWSVGEMTTVRSAGTDRLLVNAGILQGQAWQSSSRGSVRVKPTIIPNPLVSHGYLHYQEASRGTISCEITDASGKVLRKLEFAHQGGLRSYRINTQDIPAGALYFIIRFTSSTNTAAVNTDLIKVVRQ
ncbi:MAG TPA: hypothetical protein VD993_06800 [Chitinophagaceae bacterium]|nr:hypothetical protein [Chitinophagaceae bacterium]